MGVRQNFTGPHAWDNGSTPCRMHKKARLLTRPTPPATSPARLESAKTASSPRDRLIPCKAATPRMTLVSRFTPHVSRFLLEQRLLLLKPFDLTHQLLHAILQTGVVEPKQVQAIQELLSLNLRPLQRSLQPLQLKLDLLPFVNPG